MVSVKPVIRRSHTKSKIGCKTCKSRHIKCDEFQPQWLVVCSFLRTYENGHVNMQTTPISRNCLLTKRLCTYPASSTGEPVNHPVSGLSWPTDIEQSCQKWRDIGEPPFPILNLPKTPSWHSLSMRDLRYMHQLALLASILELGKTRQMCLWWCEFPLCVLLPVPITIHVLYHNVLNFRWLASFKLQLNMTLSHMHTWQIQQRGSH